MTVLKAWSQTDQLTQCKNQRSKYDTIPICVRLTYRLKYPYRFEHQKLLYFYNSVFCHRIILAERENTLTYAHFEK